MTTCCVANRLSCFVLMLCLALGASAWGQQPNSNGKKKVEYKPPPEVAVGTPLEVIDFKTTKKATFVSWLLGGRQVRVKMEDGKLRTFQATHVRLPQGSGSGAMPGGMAPAAIATMPATTPGASPMPGPAATSVATAPANPLAGLRTWTDSTGKFKIEASFVALKDEKVELRKADGTSKLLPLAKLSDADRDIANSLAATVNSPAPTAVAASPTTQPIATSTTAQPAATIYPPPTPDVPPIVATPAEFAVEGNLASVVDKGEQAPAAWRAPPAPSAEAPKIVAGNIMLSSERPNIRDFKMAGGSMEDFSKVMRTGLERGLVFERLNNHLWATLATHNDSRIRCLRFDIATGKQLKPIQFEGTRRLLDVNGATAVTLAINGDGETTDQIDVWTSEGNKLSHVMRGQPYAGQDSGAAVHSAWVLDDTHVLTRGSKNVLVLWKVPDFDPVYRLSAESVTLSDDRKCMFVGSEQGAGLYDPLTGNCFGKLPLEEKVGRCEGVFHRSENKLAVVTDAKVITYDLASGSKLTDVKLVTGLGNGTNLLGWPADDYLFCNDRVLDIKLGLPLCRYNSACRDDVRGYYAGQVWYGFDVPDSGVRRRVFVHSPMPHSAALAKAEKLEFSDTLAIKPGDKVGLQMNLSLLGNDAAGVEASWKKMIADNGWVFSNDNPVATLAGNLLSKSEQREYSVGLNHQTVSVTVYGGSVSLNMGGQSLWSVSNNWDVPFFVQVREDQSLQDVLKVKPDPLFFSTVRVPNNIQRYAAGDAIMAANVSPEGVTEQAAAAATASNGSSPATGPGAAAAAYPMPPSIIPMPGAPPAGVPSAALPSLIPPTTNPMPASAPVSNAPPAGVPSATLPSQPSTAPNPMPATSPTTSPMPTTTSPMPMPLTAPPLPTLSPPPTPAGS